MYLKNVSNFVHLIKDIIKDVHANSHQKTTQWLNLLQLQCNENTVVAIHSMPFFSFN